jgi:hypothetical protein
MDFPVFGAVRIGIEERVIIINVGLMSVHSCTF